MARSTHTLVAVASNLLLGACVAKEEASPLSAFTAYTLSAGTQAWIHDGGGGVDPDNYNVVLVLQWPSWEGSEPPDCLAISPEVTATIDGQVMKSYADGSGRALDGCTEPVFSLIVPRSRYGAEGGNARIVIRDATHTMSAEFEDFFVPREKAYALSVLSCEGVAACTGYGTH